jgi:hypothetical protein
MQSRIAFIGAAIDPVRNRYHRPEGAWKVKDVTAASSSVLVQVCMP